MEHEIVATADGVVTVLTVEVGAQVDAGALLAAIEADAEAMPDAARPSAGTAPGAGRAPRADPARGRRDLPLAPVRRGLARQHRRRRRHHPRAHQPPLRHQARAVRRGRATAHAHPRAARAGVRPGGDRRARGSTRASAAGSTRSNATATSISRRSRSPARPTRRSARSSTTRARSAALRLAEVIGLGPVDELSPERLGLLRAWEALAEGAVRQWLEYDRLNREQVHVLMVETAARASEGLLDELLAVIGERGAVV